MESIYLTADEKEIEQLNGILKAINTQLTALSEFAEKISKWPDGEHKKKTIDIIFSHQDKFTNISQGINSRLKDLGA